MGEQGAKSLRGGKMEDVIFAGTSGRPPLGRAEVLLTIDNSDGALPIEYAEVTISRTMFRSGGSEYAINGSSCRLLDVQELLSDSGIGREMHVIVGQGQLDTILHATPEDRRGFIEEAAGVLKHRKRKEKALRKLDSTEGNLTRLNDLLTEIRRQLKPLGRQAEVARRAATVQADVRDARARLLADDLVTARTALQQEMADESILVARREQVEAEIARARRGRGARSRRRCARTCPRWRRRRRPGSRCPGCASGCAAPSRWPPSGSATPPAPPTPRRRAPGATPSSSRPRPSRSASRSSGSPPRSTRTAPPSRRRSPPVVPPRTPPPRRTAGSPALQRAAADRREGLARLHGQVNALQVPRRRRRRRGRPAHASPARRPLARAERAQRDFTSLETKVAGLDAGEEGLDAEHEAAVARPRRHRGAAGQGPRRGAPGRPRPHRRSRPARTPSRSASTARTAPARCSPPPTRSPACSARSRRCSPSAPASRPRSPSALGSAADAVAVADADAAVRAIGHLKGDDLGRAGMLLGGGPDDGRDWPTLPADATYAVDVVECPDALRPALTRLLFKVAVVDDLDAARALVADLARRHRGDPRRRRARRPLRGRRLRRASPA